MHHSHPKQCSEHQFHCELNFSRGPEISTGKSRVDDLPESAGCCVQVRIAEIRVIEDIEKLSSELEVEPFGDLRIFGDVEIRIDEVWSDDRIAPHVSWMACVRTGTWRLKHRGITKPLERASCDLR